jgi:hypothetical protein
MPKRQQKNEARMSLPRCLSASHGLSVMLLASVIISSARADGNLHQKNTDLSFESPDQAMRRTVKQLRAPGEAKAPQGDPVRPATGFLDQAAGVPDQAMPSSQLQQSGGAPDQATPNQEGETTGQVNLFPSHRTLCNCQTVHLRTVRSKLLLVFVSFKPHHSVTCFEQLDPSFGTIQVMKQSRRVFPNLQFGGRKAHHTPFVLTVRRSPFVLVWVSCLTIVSALWYLFLCVLILFMVCICVPIIQYFCMYVFMCVEFIYFYASLM